MIRQNNFSAITLTVLLALGGVTVHAQVVPPSIQWENSYGGSGGEQAQCVQQTKDGGYIIAGGAPSTDGDVGGSYGLDDYWIIKLDSNFKTVWKHHYGGSNNDEAYCIRQTPDGGYIIAGSTQSNDHDVTGFHSGSTNEDCWIVKLDSLGNLEWQKSLGGGGADVAWNINLTRDGGYIFTGETQSVDGDVKSTHHGDPAKADCWVVKLDSLGAILWERSLGGTAQDVGWGVEEMKGGGYMLAATTASNDDDVSGNHGAGDYWIVRLDALGHIMRQKCFGGSSQEDVGGMIITNDGGCIVTGYCSSNDGDVTGYHGGQDVWVVKIDSNGLLQWDHSYGGSGQDEDFRNIVQTTDGGYAFSAFSNSLDGDVKGNHGNGDFWVVKLDDIGSIQWNKCLGGSGNSLPYWIECTRDGGYVIAGSSTSTDGDVSNNHGSYDYWIVKLIFPPIIASRQQVSFPDLVCGNQENDTVWIHNIGSKPLVIDSAEYTSFRNLDYWLIDGLMPHTIAPGDSAPFIIEFTPRSVGSFPSALNLYSNDSAHFPWVINISGRKDSIGFSVSGIKNDTIDFGLLNCGMFKDITFTLSSTSSVPTTFAFKHSSSDFDVAAAVLLSSGSTQAVTVQFVGASAPGRYTDSVIVTDTCGRSSTIFLNATVDAPTFVISPVTDITLCPTDTLVRFLTVKNTSHLTQHLALSGVSPLFSATPNNVTLGAGDSTSVQIVFHGSASVGAYTATFGLVDNCGGTHAFSATVHVDISHIAVPLSIDTSVCPQTPLVMTLPITNNDALARNVTLTSSSWPLSKQNFLLQGGQRDSVTLTFPGGALGVYTSTVHVTDDCGGSHDVAFTVTVRNQPSLQLSLLVDPAFTRVGAERKVYVVANPVQSVTSGLSFAVTNEATALQFDSVSTPCNIFPTIGANTVSFSVNGCPLSTSDTIAVLYYQTLVGSTLSPSVKLVNVSTTQTCQTVSATGSVRIFLLPPGCELGTVTVHPFASSIQSIFPNPATGVTTITYSTVENTKVNLNVCDALGRTVRTLVNTMQQPGTYVASFDTDALMNGMYFVEMREGNFAQTRELLLMR